MNNRTFRAFLVLLSVSGGVIAQPFPVTLGTWQNVQSVKSIDDVVNAFKAVGATPEARLDGSVLLFEVSSRLEASNLTGLVMNRLCEETLSSEVYSQPRTWDPSSRREKIVQINWKKRPPGVPQELAIQNFVSYNLKSSGGEPKVLFFQAVATAFDAFKDVTGSRAPYPATPASLYVNGRATDDTRDRAYLCSVYRNDLVAEYPNEILLDPLFAAAARCDTPYRDREKKEKKCYVVYMTRQHLLPLSLQAFEQTNPAKLAEQAREEEARRKSLLEAQARDEDARRAAEQVRQQLMRQEVAGFRKRLSVGTDTHCGPVIEVRKNLAKVYFPVKDYGSEHWIRFADVFPPGYQCRFVNGQYVAPDY